MRRLRQFNRRFWFPFSVVLVVGIVGVVAGFVMQNQHIRLVSMWSVCLAIGMATGRQITKEECRRRAVTLEDS